MSRIQRTGEDLLGERIRLDNLPKIEGPRVIPTGNHNLDDDILTIGGIARGTLVDFFGGVSSGKSTICAHIIANAQALGLRCAVLDTEGFFRTEEGAAWAQTIGVRPDMLDYWNQIGPAENLLQGLTLLMRERQYGVVLIDSLAGLRTRGQLEGVTATGEGEAHSGGTASLARCLSFHASILHQAAADTGTAIICTNQMRENLRFGTFQERTGTMKKMARSMFYTPGGSAIQYHADVRLYLNRLDAIIDISESGQKAVLGTVAEALLVKSRVSPPFRRTGVDCDHITFFFDGRMQDKFAVLLESALRRKIITLQPGGRYILPDSTVISGGKEKFRAIVEGDPAWMTWLETTVRSVFDAGVSDGMKAAAATEGITL